MNLQTELQELQGLIQLIIHSLTCTRPRHCPMPHCGVGKDVLRHIIACDSGSCDDANCKIAKGAMRHYLTCRVRSAARPRRDAAPAAVDAAKRHRSQLAIKPVAFGPDCARKVRFG